MLKYEDLMFLIEENRNIIRGFGVRKLGIFGSSSIDEHDEESDVDILVDFFDSCKTFDNYMDLKFFLEDLFDKKVDLVMVGSLKPDLKPYILESVKYAAGL